MEIPSWLSSARMSGTPLTHSPHLSFSPSSLLPLSRHRINRNPSRKMSLALGHKIPDITTRVSCNAKTITDAKTPKSGLAATLCFARERELETLAPPLLVRRRNGLSACFTALTLSLAFPSLAAILEADDDEELLEKVKSDRKKRIQRQGVISSSAKETGYLQELVYKLSKVGKAIENNDFSEASSVLGPSTRADWIQNVNVAFTKLTSSPEEKSEVDAFNSSLASLISSGPRILQVGFCFVGYCSGKVGEINWFGGSIERPLNMRNRA